MNKTIAYILLFTLGTVFLSNGNTENTSAIEFEVEGIQVILKYAPKKLVSARLFIRGGTDNYPAEKQGLENLTLQLMMEGGTTTMDKLVFKKSADKVGARLGTNIKLDHSSINMKCPLVYWDKSWSLFSELITQPAFLETEFLNIQQQLISEAMLETDDPDKFITLMSRQNSFPGSNYTKSPVGNPESLRNITLEDVKAYYHNTISKKQCFLVVVGDVSQADITAKIKSAFADLPQGKYNADEQIVKISEQNVFIENRDLPTNYIIGIMQAPPANTDDGISMQIAMSMVQKRYFSELRTKRSLSYFPNAFYELEAITKPHCVLYISTTQPEQSLQVMVDVINQIKQEGFTEKELQSVKEIFLTDYYWTLESTSAQAAVLGEGALKGDWKLLDSFTEKASKMTLSDINRVFDQYSMEIVWTYLGKEDMVKETDFLQPSESQIKPY